MSLAPQITFTFDHHCANIKWCKNLPMGNTLIMHSNFQTHLWTWQPQFGEEWLWKQKRTTQAATTLAEKSEDLGDVLAGHWRLGCPAVREPSSASTPGASKFTWRALGVSRRSTPWLKWTQATCHEVRIPGGWGVLF